MTIEQQLQQLYGLHDVVSIGLKTLANDAFMITSSQGKFALKVYNPNSRSKDDVKWEIDLTEHLIKKGVPVAKPVRGTHGLVSTFAINGEERTTILFEWVPGEKPKPAENTYFLMGQVAAKIHQAADSFSQPTTREVYDMEYLIDEQIERMRDILTEVGVMQKVTDLTDRLKKRLQKLELDKGICHIDLTLDNIHINDGEIFVFDFDSAAECWRAYEAWGVLKSSQWRFDAWLKGYRTIRPFSADDEMAVACFVIIGDIANTTWKLGLANSSRGKPLMKTAELPQVVDEWLEWEKEHVL